MNYKSVLLKMFETTKKQKKTKTTVSLRSLREPLCGSCVVYFLVAYSYYQKYNFDIYIINMLNHNHADFVR